MRKLEKGGTELLNLASKKVQEEGERCMAKEKLGLGDSNIALPTYKGYGSKRQSLKAYD
ncbi:uncharacterized protein G2W53_042319 [Senna tora]|uniref:Uncharacterized protein n=1 Tax=Senna tora TaxID=362788 RepID=A0A834VYW7_9FABA|nr:uncharacterized protein G2W53_042319 [Senna tora]